MIYANRMLEAVNVNNNKLRASYTVDRRYFFSVFVAKADGHRSQLRRGLLIIQRATWENLTQ